MIKISFWMCASCLIGWIIFVKVVAIMGAIIESSDWWGIIAITASIALFALCYLGYHIIKGNKGAIRLGMLISVLWFVCSCVILEPYRYIWNYDDWTRFFFGIGLLPVILYAGILWVTSGFLSNKNK